MKLIAPLSGVRWHLLALLALGATWWPFFVSTRVDNRFADWTYRAQYAAYERNAILHDHEFPFWVTSARFEQFRIAGLHAFFSNPETDVISVFTPFAIFSDLLTAAKVSLAVNLFVGIFGFAKLLRVLGGRGAGPLLPLGTVLSFGNGAFVGHVLAGHLQFIPAASFPLALAFELEAADPLRPLRKRTRDAIAAGAILAAAYYAGAAHPTIGFVICFCATLPAVLLALHPRQWRATVFATLAVAGSGAAFAAFKLLPGLVEYGRYVPALRIYYTGPLQALANLVVPWVPAAWHETHMYVGWIGVGVLAFAARAIVRPLPRCLFIACVLSSTLMFLPAESPLFRFPLLATQVAPTRLRILLLMATFATSLSEIDLLIVSMRSSSRVLLVSILVACVTAFVAIDYGRRVVAEHIAESARDPVPRVLGPYDMAPHFAGAGAAVWPTNVAANVFTYEFVELAGTGFLKSDVVLRSRGPRLLVSGDARLSSAGRFLRVRVTARQGYFTLRFYDPWVRIGALITAIFIFGMALRAARGNRSGP